MAQDTPTSVRQVDEKSAKTGSGASPRPLSASFLDHLVRNNVITHDIALSVAATKQDNPAERRTVVELLLDGYGIPRETIQQQIAHFYAFRTIDLSERSTRRMLNSESLKLMRGLPEQFRVYAIKQKVVPYDFVDNKLILVTPNPSDREIVEIARHFPYKKFEVCYMKERDWDDLWRQMSADKGAQAKSPIIADVVKIEDERDLDAILDREISRAQLPTLIEGVFVDAIKAGASAIHFVPKTARKTDVYFRVDGALSSWYSIDDVRTEAVTVALKLSTSGLDRYERLATQRGSMAKTADGRLIHFHISTMPITLRATSGRYELVVVRIEREPEESWTLDSIGLEASASEKFKEVLALQHGVIIFSGPADSGVATTLSAALRGISSFNLNVVAIEESMEFAFEGVNHVRLTPKLTLDEAAAAVGRFDPDVVVLGEIRKRQDADLALRCAMEGKLVFASMQAADAAGVVVRLYGMGVEPYLLAQSLKLVHAQRLVRRLCPKCQTELSGIDRRLSALGIPDGSTALFGPTGCNDCVGGYLGLVPLHETMPISPEMRMVIASGRQPSPDVLRVAMRNAGGATLLENGVRLLLEGTTSLNEVWHALS